MTQETNAAEKALRPPVAARVPKEITQHGQTRVDPYFWLRDKENPETIKYLEAENAYTEAILKPTAQLQQQLYDEMLGRIKQTDLSVPYRKGDYFYYSRTEEGKQYPIHCRKKNSLEGAEEILLDLNELAKTEKYLRLGSFAVSPSQNLLAYGIETSGDETYTVRVKNLETGTLLPDRIDNTYYGLEWSNDNRSLVYVILDPAKRPYQAWRHTLGSEAKDQLVYEEKDERYHLSLGKSRGDAYFFLQLGSHSTNEIRYFRASGDDWSPVVFAPRTQDIEYDLEHHTGTFYVRIADTGRNFRLVAAPIANPSRENWKELIAHRPNVMIEGTDAFENHLVILEREDGIRRFRVRDLASGKEHSISMPEKVYTLMPSTNADFKTKVFRFQYTSLVTPMSVFDYNLDTKDRTLLKQTEVLGGYDPAKYESIRVHATAPDGVKIPISMVYRKGTQRNGANPMLLYGYGSYGIPTDPIFSSDRLSLIDRGFIYAIAHIRGGSDLGKTWYDSGKLKMKMNTFQDFISSAKFLIDEKYTSAAKLGIMGGSAGGLLMGAVVNLRPDLFKAVVSKVPFVDVLNTITDPSLPLTVIEYEEWGDPNKKEFWDYIKSYSPYDNIEKQVYPNILVTAGLNDPRVSYWEPTKMVAKLRTMKKGDNLLLLKTNMAAGHGGASGRYDRLKEIAVDYAFLIHVIIGQ